ncbi:MAG: hypothetical protein K2Y37_24890 [Pirellulales bacterium]|nr:hypothetical protein [Pirellulales bacterium]
MQSYANRAAMARSRAQAQRQPEVQAEAQSEVLPGAPTEVGRADGPGAVEYGEQIELKPGQDVTIGRGGDVVITPVPPMRGRPRWKPRFKLAPMNIPMFTEPGPAHDFFFESARNTMMGLAINAPWELNNGYAARKPVGWQYAWPSGDMAGDTPVIPHGGLTDYSASIDNAESLIGPMKGWQGSYGPLPYAHELPGESLGPFDDEQEVAESVGQPTPADALSGADAAEEVPGELLKPGPEVSTPTSEDFQPSGEHVPAPDDAERPAHDPPTDESAAESGASEAGESPSDETPTTDDGPTLPLGR